MALRTRARSTRLLVVALVSISLRDDHRGLPRRQRRPPGVARRRCARGDQPAPGGVSKVTHPIGNFFSTLSGCPRSVKSATSCANAWMGSRPSSPRAERTRQGSTSWRRCRLAGEPREPDRDDGGPGDRQRGLELRVDDHDRQGSSVGITWACRWSRAQGSWGVVRVGTSSSVVQLIIDPDSSVAGRLDVAPDRVALGLGALRPPDEPGGPDCRCRPDEHVVTAGYRIAGVAESLYPPNVLIGTVSRVLDEDSATEKLLTVRPGRRLLLAVLVLVVLSRDERG